MDKNSLSHTRWNCEYHIVFVAKYRRQKIYGKLKQDIGKILRDLLTRKGVKIIEAEICPDPTHMNDGLLFCIIGLLFIITCFSGVASFFLLKPQNHPEFSGWFFNKF